MKLIKKYDKEQILLVNPLTLAFVGDAVFSLYVRDYLTNKSVASVNVFTKQCSKYVNAGNQYKIYRKIENILTEDEHNICMRARNTNIHSKAKNYSITEYIYATAFEALLGYLYLIGEQDRLDQILEMSVEEVWK